MYQGARSNALPSRLGNRSIDFNRQITRALSHSLLFSPLFCSFSASLSTPSLSLFHPPLSLCGPFRYFRTTEALPGSLLPPSSACGTISGARCTTSPAEGTETGRASPRDRTTGISVSRLPCRVNFRHRLLANATHDRTSHPFCRFHYSCRDFTTNSLPGAVRQRVGYTDNTDGAVVPITGEKKHSSQELSRRAGAWCTARGRSGEARGANLP